MESDGDSDRERMFTVSCRMRTGVPEVTCCTSSYLYCMSLSVTSLPSSLYSSFLFPSISPSPSKNFHFSSTPTHLFPSTFLLHIHPLHSYPLFSLQLSVPPLFHYLLPGNQCLISFRIRLVLVRYLPGHAHLTAMRYMASLDGTIPYIYHSFYLLLPPLLSLQ